MLSTPEHAVKEESKNTSGKTLGQPATQPHSTLGHTLSKEYTTWNPSHPTTSKKAGTKHPAYYHLLPIFSLRTPWKPMRPKWGPALQRASTTHTLPKSVSHASLASLFPVPREPPVALVPGSRAQALAMDVTRYSSSALRQPHQLISGWLQRAMAAPLRRCLTEQKKNHHALGIHSPLRLRGTDQDLQSQQKLLVHTGHENSNQKPLEGFIVYKALSHTFFKWALYSRGDLDSSNLHSTCSRYRHPAGEQA